MTAREFHYRWTWDLPAPPDALWPLVSDTDAFNRDTGLPTVEDAREAGVELEQARRRLRFSLAGVTVEWEELPFEWVRPRRFGVVRRYARGPLAEMRVLAELEPLGSGGTRLSYKVMARPSGVLGLLAIPLQIGVLSRRTFGKVFREYGALAAAAAEESTPQGPRPAPTARLRRQEGMEARLVEAGVEPAVARRLTALVLGGDEGSLVRMRPYLLADVWGLPRRQALEAFLHATRAGFLQLRWDVLCPLCRGVKERSDSLQRLRTRGVHCDTCRVDFSGSFTESVELSFRPTPALREVGDRAYCVAGPQVTPHVVVQQLLAPGETRELVPSLTPGGYRFRAHGSPAGVDVRVAGEGAAEAEATLTPEGWESSAALLATGPTLRLGNATDTERLVVLERAAWADDAVTAGEVTRLGLFRDLFSEELLEVGDFAEVGTLSILFTDLRGSTGLYRAVGDAPAFGRVMEHFDALLASIRDADGTVVKTIGDAVMAVFAAPEAAVAAALDAIQRVEALRLDPPLVLKAGVHRGPCIMVTLNDRLDYFGTTVNIAARLEGMSNGGDVVVSDGVRRDPGVDELIGTRGVQGAPFRSAIRGLGDEEVTVWRLTPGRPGGSGDAS